MPAPHVDLTLPASEQALLASLGGAWLDLRYVPGPGFTAPLDPGVYRSSLVIVPAVGSPVRVSSLVAPAFGGELCRIRLEALPPPPAPHLGSFFEPARRGIVYALTPDPADAAAPTPERAGWAYERPELASWLGPPRRIHVLRERGRGPAGSWQADRGLVLTGAGRSGLLLATTEAAEAALFLPAPGLYHALLDPAAGARPGAGPRDLLGYGDWPVELEVTVERLPVEAAVAEPRDPV